MKATFRAVLVVSLGYLAACQSSEHGDDAAVLVDAHADAVDAGAVVDAGSDGSSIPEDASLDDAGTDLDKTPIHGLTAMGDVSYNWKGGMPDNQLSEITTHPNVYAGAVINVLWSQLEPTQGQYDFSAIDGTGSYVGQGLAAIAAYNATASLPVRAKLRIHTDGPPSNPGSPAYVLGYGNTTQGVTINSGDNIVGAYWGAETQGAFTNLQNALAARYDTNEALAEITVETCSSVGAEPYIEVTDQASVTTLAGLSGPAYSDANRKACYAAAASAYSAWKHTPLDSDYNQFLGTDECRSNGFQSGCVNKDPSFTIATMQSFAAPSGARNPRAILANHDLPGGTMFPLTGNGLATFYGEFNTAGPPVELQTTVGLDGVGACQALQLGVQYSMTEMEIHQTASAPNGPQGMSATLLDEAQLEQLKTMLANRDTTSVCSSVMPVYQSGT